MSDELLQLSHPAPGWVNLRRLGILMALSGLGVFLLWWVDPRQVPVPVCGLYASTGLHCPGCGATRATHELLHGRLLSALAHNALWVALLPVVLYGGLSEALYFVGRRRLPGNLLGKRWFYAVLAVAAALFGVLRNLPWEPFTRLAPPG